MDCSPLVFIYCGYILPVRSISRRLISQSLKSSPRRPGPSRGDASSRMTSPSRHQQSQSCSTIGRCPQYHLCYLEMRHWLVWTGFPAAVSQLLFPDRRFSHPQPLTVRPLNPERKTSLFLQITGGSAFLQIKGGTPSHISLLSLVILLYLSQFLSVLLHSTLRS